MELLCLCVVPCGACVQYLLSVLPSAVEFEGALGRLPKASITSPRRTLEVSKAEPGHSIEREVERDLSSHQKRRLVFFTIEKVSEGEIAVVMLSRLQLYSVLTTKVFVRYKTFCT